MKRPSGLTYIIHKKNPTSFRKRMIPWNKGKKGLMPTPWNKGLKGIHFSPETEFKKGQIPWNKGKPHLQDEKHPQWKGNNVGYLGIHAWINRKLGKPNKCEKCKTKIAKRFEWANISMEYKRNYSDWKRLCSKCHANEHRNWEVRWNVVI